MLRIAVALVAASGMLALSEPARGMVGARYCSPATVDARKARRTRQIEARLRAGGNRRDHDLVCPTRAGTPTHPRNLVRSFHALGKRAGMDDLRFHDLRHSCFSLLAAQGIPARMAMEIAGHSNIRLTQNVYMHVYDEAKREVADVVDRLFPEAAIAAGD